MAKILTAEDEKAISRVTHHYWWLLLIPLVMLVLIMIGYAIAGFWIQQSGGSEDAMAGLNMLLGFVGIFAVIVFVLFGVLAVIGSVTFKRRVKRMINDTVYDALTVNQIIYLAKSSNTALLASPIFTLGNRMYIWAIAPTFSWILGYLSPFISNVPVRQALGVLGIVSAIVTLGIIFILSANGRQLAWKHDPKKDFNAFRKRQQVIAWIALVWATVLIVIGIFQFRKLDSIASQIANGEIDRIEGAYQAMKFVQPGINDFDAFKRGFSAGGTAGSQKNIVDATISPQLLLELGNNFSLVNGYAAGFLDGCQESLSKTPDECKKRLTDFVNQTKNSQLK